MPHPEPRARPRARDDVIFRQLDEEWVLYDPVTEQLHVLNGSAALVWVHCSGDLTPEEITERLHEAYAQRVPRDTLRADVRRALSTFADKELLA